MATRTRLLALALALAACRDVPPPVDGASTTRQDAPDALAPRASTSPHAADAAAPRASTSPHAPVAAPLGSAGEPDPIPVASAIPPGSATATKPLDRVIAGVRAESATQFLVTRDALAAIQDGSAELSRLARVIPHRVDGHVTGLKLSGLRSGSALEALGLRNGDVLRAVGGHTLESPASALDAYASVRDANLVELVLERGGTPLTLRYRVVERLP